MYVTVVLRVIFWLEWLQYLHVLCICVSICTDAHQTRMKDAALALLLQYVTNKGDRIFTFWAHVWRTRATYYLNDYQGSLQDFDYALQLNPGLIWFKSEREDVYRKLNRKP